MNLSTINTEIRNTEIYLEYLKHQHFLLTTDPLLVDNFTQEGFCMAGKIRTKEKCPVCGEKFEDIGREFICKEHYKIPNRYFIDIYWKGRQHKIYSDSDGKVLNSYPAALDLLTEIKQKIKKHRFDPVDYVAKNYTKQQFNVYARRWVSKYKEMYERDEASKSTWKRKQISVEKYFIPFFKKIDIRDIKTGDVEDFYFSLSVELAASTKKNIMKSLSALFNSAKRRRDIKEVPEFPKIKLPEPTTAWIDEEAQIIIYEQIPARHKPIFLFMLRQGVRPGEARAVRFEDFDWKGRAIMIRRAFSDNECREWTKTKKIRLLPLDDEVYEMLKSQNAITGFAFTDDNGEPYKWNQQLRAIWNKAVRDAGFGHIKLKDGTRHSFASQAVNRGVPLNLIQAFLGHIVPSTTERYAHLDTTGLQIVIEKGTKIVKMESIKNKSKD